MYPCRWIIQRMWGPPMRFKYNEGNDEEEIKIGELAKKILDVAGVDKAIEPLKRETESLFR